MSPHRTRRVLRWSTQGRPFGHGRNTASVPSISLPFSSDIQQLLLLPSTAIPYKLALGPPPCLPKASRGQVIALLAPPPSSGTQIPCVQAFRHLLLDNWHGRAHVCIICAVGGGDHPSHHYNELRNHTWPRHRAIARCTVSRITLPRYWHYLDNSAAKFDRRAGCLSSPPSPPPPPTGCGYER